MIKDALIGSLGIWALGERMWSANYPQSTNADSPEPVTLIVPELSTQVESIALTSQLTFILPISGLSLSSLPTSRLPNALRLYRHGIHCGLDLYCRFGTEVRAVADGIVTRADNHFTELSPGLHRHLLKTCVALNTTPPDVLRRLTGRSVEVDHNTHEGARVRSVYGHLSDLCVSEGEIVRQGDSLGAVGNSGTTAGVRGSGEDAHLHLEIWTHRAGSREAYLGQGIPEQQLRQLLLEVFSHD